MARRPIATVGSPRPTTPLTKPASTKIDVIAARAGMPCAARCRRAAHPRFGCHEWRIRKRRMSEGGGRSPASDLYAAAPCAPPRSGRRCGRRVRPWSNLNVKLPTPAVAERTSTIRSPISIRHLHAHHVPAVPAARVSKPRICPRRPDMAAFILAVASTGRRSPPGRSARAAPAGTAAIPRGRRAGRRAGTPCRRSRRCDRSRR